MTAATIETFDDVSAWRARRANNTASNEISIALDGQPRLAQAFPSPRRPTARITATANSATHRAERNGAAVDLSTLADITLWVRGEQRADGSSEHPFFAEVRLGSTALAPGANGNDWRRFIPILNPRSWEYVPLSLVDLAPEVRNGVTAMWITSINQTAWTLGMDAIIAVRDEVLVDTDAALRDALHQHVRAGGNLLPAALAPTAAPPNEPYVRITHNSMRPLLAEAPVTPSRTDFVATGFALRRPSMPVELTYAIEVVTQERSIAAEAASSVLELLLGRDVLIVSGRPCRLELLDPGPPVLETSAVGAGLPAPPSVPVPPLFTAPPIYIRVISSIRRPSAPDRAVPPFNVVAVEVDQHASA